MKIAIVGGGLAGLPTYLFLKKLLPATLPPEETVEVTLYEKYEVTKSPRDGPGDASRGTIPSVGAALGVSPNGMHVLRDIDEELYREVSQTGNPMRTMSMRSRLGWTLTRFSAEDYDTPATPTVMIARQDLWRILRRRVADSDIQYRTVAGVDSRQGHKPRLRFSNGTTSEEFDLVVGADGVKSVVRRTVLDDEHGHKYPVTYEGLTSVFGFVPESVLGTTHRKDEMVLSLSGEGFFGYGLYKSAGQLNSHDDMDIGKAESQAVWWSTYPLQGDPAEHARIGPGELVDDLRRRHSDWRDPAIQRIVKSAQVDTVWPTWTVSEIPTWTLNGNVVLVGDAAHALQSSSGQGVSQALEDAQVLSYLLTHFLPQPNGGIDAALKAYMDMRKPRVDRIAAMSRQRGDTKRRKGLLEEWIMYFFIWAFSKWPWDPYTEWLQQDLPLKHLRDL